MILRTDGLHHFAWFDFRLRSVLYAQIRRHPLCSCPVVICVLVMVSYMCVCYVFMGLHLACNMLLSFLWMSNVWWLYGLGQVEEIFRKNGFHEIKFIPTNLILFPWKKNSFPWNKILTIFTDQRTTKLVNLISPKH